MQKSKPWYAIMAATALWIFVFAVLTTSLGFGWLTPVSYVAALAIGFGVTLLMAFGTRIRDALFYTSDVKALLVEARQAREEANRVAEEMSDLAEGIAGVASMLAAGPMSQALAEGDYTERLECELERAAVRDIVTDLLGRAADSAARRTEIKRSFNQRIRSNLEDILIGKVHDAVRGELKRRYEDRCERARSNASGEAGGEAGRAELEKSLQRLRDEDALLARQFGRAQIEQVVRNTRCSPDAVRDFLNPEGLCTASLDSFLAEFAKRSREHDVGLASH